MLKKLLKYDFIETYKTVIPGYAVATLSSILLMIASHFTQSSTIINVIVSIFMFIFIVSLVVTFLLSMFSAIRRFYLNILKDEGYLTHVLPVSKSSIVFSKLLSGSVVILTTLLLTVFLTFFTLRNYIDFNEALGAISSNKTTIMFSCLIVFAFFIQFVTVLCSFYTALTLGHTHSDSKIMYSVLYGVIIYMIFQLLTGLAVVATFVFNNNLEVLINSDGIESLVGVNQLFIWIIALYSIWVVINFITTTKTLQNKLNLD